MPEACKKAMSEITGPILAITFVLLSVFVPVAFIPGISGLLFRQFAVAVSVSVLIFYVLWGNQLPFDRGSLYPLHNLVAFGLPLAVLWLQLRQPGAASEPVYAARKRGVRSAEYGMTRT